jgi:hypothetical protein
MKAATLRTLAAVAIAAGIALAAVAPALAADTLGATVNSDGQSAITVLSTGSILTVFTFAGPAGVSTDPISLSLAPGASGTVRIVGSGPGVISVTGKGIGVAPGADRSSIMIDVHLVGAPVPVPADYSALAGLLTLAVLVAFLLAIRYRRRDYQWFGI